MKTLSLNGAWTLTISTETRCASDLRIAASQAAASDPARIAASCPIAGRPIPAVVPGSVYSDLLREGLIDDPFYRDNENAALQLMEHDFIYRRQFTVSADLLTSDEVLLRAEGLDTIAEIRINGIFIGNTFNMHRTWEFDVRGALRDGVNEIEIRFSSPTAYIREAYACSRADGTSDAMRGFPLIRKAHCMFGWDWGPRLPDAGIWRGISIIGIEGGRIGDVIVRQAHRDDGVLLAVTSRVVPTDSASSVLEVTVTDPNGEIVAEMTRSLPGTGLPGSGTGISVRADSRLSAADVPATAVTVSAEIRDPKLWNPAGFGDQPLYTVRVKLLREDRELDSRALRVGLRTAEIHREKDSCGESFCQRVNGRDIFAMGADYIPEDSLVTRMTPERTRRLLEDAKAAGMNTIRVWGGGFYPGDDFYDICDELGLMVWQDFMFACAVYNLTDDFDRNIRAELRDNIRRIRHHACLMLWCGNNEMEDFVAKDNEWVTSKRQTADYIKMYEYVIPQVLSKEDPETFYWPSSPSSGGSFDEPQDPSRGDVHYWDVWHGMKPFTDYRNYLFRYVSEFGFQAFPCMETIESFTLPEDRNAYSYVMEKHQRNASANGRIASYLSAMYLYPSSLDGFVYASQLLQGQAIQYGVEHWRRNRGRCMGAVVWQLNDCWPVVSWSSIDYYGRWKALHYFEKRFFAPVLISCEEEGILTQDTNVNAEPSALRKSIRLNVSNETPRDFSGTVRWALRRPDASVIREGHSRVRVPALSALWLDREDFSGEDTYGCYVSYELQADADGSAAAREAAASSGPAAGRNGHADARGTGSVSIGSGTVLFCPPKHFRFEDPRLTAEPRGDEIVVCASAYARYVEVRCGADVVLSDNYFDMNAGEKTIRIVRGTPDGDVRVRSVYDLR